MSIHFVPGYIKGSRILKGEKRTNQPTSPTFIPVEASEHMMSVERIVIELPGGVRITIER